MNKPIEEIAKERWNCSEELNINELLNFVKSNFDNKQVEVIMLYSEGVQIKDIIKKCHIAESRIRNLIINVIDKYYKLRLNKA